MRQVGDTGVMVAPVGIDGGVFGWTSGASATSRALDSFADAGGNLVCTADHYAGGRSEVMIGSWLATLADRSKAVVSTTIGRHPDALGLGSREVVRAAEGSLRRLGTDYIDFLTLDGGGDAPDVPIDDTLEALDMLRRSGKVRHVAVTGHSVARIRAIDARAEEAVYPSVSAIVQQYSLMQRSVFERDLAPLAAELGAGVFAQFPLAHGFLTGDFRDRSASVDAPGAEEAVAHVGRRGSRVLAAMEGVAAEHGTSLACVAVAWTISRPGVTAAVVVPRSVDELLGAFDARGLSLTRQQVAMLDKASE
ncbi:aldo/keto reductase [Homoserinimonas aerilata]|nr:aldo/keto reductase [Homoserinimonas aerilata]